MRRPYQRYLANHQLVLLETDFASVSRAQLAFLSVVIKAATALNACFDMQMRLVSFDKDNMNTTLLTALRFHINEIMYGCGIR